MNITVVCVGKIKEKYWNNAIDEYAKRLSRYCRLQIIEVQDEATPEHASETLEKSIIRKEGARILSRINQDAYVIALAIKGEKMDSVSFSKRIDHLCITGKSNLVYVIGGSLGLSEEVLSRADEQLSFSDMTFPHQMMRVILLEQIYRAFRIMKNEPYHK